MTGTESSPFDIPPAAIPDTMASGRRGMAGRLRAAAPYALALGLFALGVYALQHLLAPVDIHAVAAQIRGTPVHLIAAALAATFAGYMCLAAYDWSALRHIGKPLPLSVTMSGGFLAYAFGNTVGLNAVSGGAVRWRLYSGLGLDGFDVAAVSAFAAMAFGTAATLAGLGALAIHPEGLASVLPFGPGTTRLVACLGLAAAAAPVLRASLTGRRLTVGRFSLQAPTPRLLAIQMAISLGDICFSALTLYLLLPAGGPDFATFLAVFAVATMAGVLSHVPGGVGVFETVVIAAFPPGYAVEEIAAALLLYRFVYYLVPFAAALVLMSGFEAWRALGGRAAEGAARGTAGRIHAAIAPAFRAIAPAAPLLLAVMVFGSGLWMSLSALLPPVSKAAETAEALFPLAFLEGSALVQSAVGALLIVLASGVARRSAGALWLSLGAMGIGAAAAFFHGVEPEQGATLLLGMALLWPYRTAFRRRSVLTHAAFSPAWAALSLAGLAAAGFVLFFAHKSTPYAHELWWQFARDETAPRALRAGLVISLGLGAGALALLLRAPRVRPVRPGPGELAAAEAVLRAGAAPEAGFALTGDKALMFSEARDAFVMFGVSGGSWIALGGPVGPAAAAEDVAFDFVEEARRAGARPVFYEIAAADVPVMLDLGMQLHKMGEEAMVDLTRFSLEGSARKKLRAAHARAGRDGLSLSLLSPPHDAALTARLRGISDQWLIAKHAREKGFSVGRFDPEWLGRWPLAVVLREGIPVAFANVMVADGGRSASIDLMRHADDAPAGTMDYLFTELMLQLKAQGAARFSLGMAPLSGLTPERSGRLWDRFGAAIYRHGGGFYNFEGLRAFKQKFDPDWRPRWLATPSGAPPLLPLADAARLISGRKRAGEIADR